ncbi:MULTISPECIES: type II secretion system F family protein [Cupriavidus]|uniref:Type II secretion system F family protein n=1 Tax=Cupriavidus pauculus TaxID=82633 RepID=A0A3G8GVV4_9BURK|nr:MULTISPECIES: type II secretion system F family protein [Cupriavidus]AZG12353.1 type II secretion system F family protein [Cupriavidus pauculus]MDT6960804.1 type II secretion system F family protein [Cupriavidus sp. SZY C1]
MNGTMIGFAVSVFLACVLGAAGAWQWWHQTRSQRARRFSHRVEAAMLNSASHAADASILKQRVLSESPEMAQLLRRLPRVDKLDLMLLQSGLNWSVGRLLALCAMAGLLAVAGLVPFHPPWFALVPLTACAAALPLLYLLRRRARRLATLEAQLPEAADLLARALRAGHSLPSALDMAGQELPAPIGTELALVFGEINYGIPLADALAGLNDRVPLEDLRYLVIAILIQRESGGNLAEILDNVGSLIRKRLQLMDKIRVLSAEGRLGGWILTALPVIVGGIVYQINPDLMATLWTDPAGIKMLWYAVAMTCVGIVWMRQIVRIHV